ncbi:MAG TPA: hypothetical protein VK174_13490, partial [Chitinophagales bacterium]|nr:hypothetical protein [Chitinophagales bacterium]
MNAKSNIVISAPIYTIELREDSLPKKGRPGTSPITKAVSDTLTQGDSAFTTVADTFSLNDTIDANKDGEINDVITYKAADSIVYDMNTKKMYLYNGSDVKYQKIKLKA